MPAAFLAIVAGTFVSEDATAVATGLLIRDGRLPAAQAIAACAIGVYLGDLALWGVGRSLGRRVLSWSRVRRVVTPSREAAFERWFTRNAAPALIGSRFVPGTRLPLYLAAGALGGSFARFAAWTLVAVLLWVPLIVLLSASFLYSASEVIAASTGGSPTSRLGAALLLIAVWRAAAALATKRGRQRLAAATCRVWRWEFWPMWLFYAPVALWTLVLAVRYGGFGTMTASNPGIPDGGVVGESKHDILSRLPAEWTVPSILVLPGAADERMWQMLDRVARRGWRLPLVLKPDAGQRGAGVRIVRTTSHAREYLEQQRGPVLVQPYHPGPFEAGIFYYRWPDASHGRILSITDKCFPCVTGDGRSTLEDLIWADGRLRMQAGTFLRRHAHARGSVPAAGERIPLALAGNHAQGTMFRDGRHLITPALEARVDEIARAYDGFFVGRFDVRYSDVERFKAGEDLAIVELNGATAEATSIYDPSGSLVSAYAMLFRQWRLVFAIGAANRARGAKPSSTRRLVELLRAHMRVRVAFPVSD